MNETRNSLTIEEITKIITETETSTTPLSSEKTETLQVFRTIMGKSRKTLKASEALEAQLLRNERFKRSLESIRIHFHKHTERSLVTQVAALHRLLVQGELENLYTRFLEREGIQDDLAPEQILELKVKLATDFISKITRNTEAAPESNENDPTFGLELEYISYDSLVRTLETQFNEALGVIRKKTNLNIYKNAISDLDEFSSSPDPELKSVYTFFQKIKTLFPNRQLPIQGYYSKILQVIEKHDINRDVLRNFAALPFSPWRDDQEIDDDNLPRYATNREIITKADITLRSQLRELVMVAGPEIEGFWNLHLTIGGVEISPQNHQLMDVLCMAAAAGFLPEKMFEGIIAAQEEATFDAENDEDAPTVIRLDEKLTKHSYISSNPDLELYFPFHRTRDGVIIKPLEGRVAPTHDFGTEVRSILRYEQGEFPLLVRYLDFMEKVTPLVRAVQQGENNELTKLWDELQQAFTDLFIEMNLPDLNDEDYYAVGKPALNLDNESELESTNRYNEKLTEILMQSLYFNPEVKARAKKIIIEFKKRLKELRS